MKKEFMIWSLDFTYCMYYIIGMDKIVYIGIYNAPQIELAVAVQRHSFSCTRRVARFRRFKIRGRSPKPEGGDWHPLIASNSAFEKPSSLKHVIRGPLTAHIIRY